MNDLNNKLKDTIINYLIEEIAIGVDSGLSQEILSGEDIWVDTLDKSHAINIVLDWDTEWAPRIGASAYPLKKNGKDLLEEDMAAEEIFIDFSFDN
tara:strand:- start:2541 stop:2828 length:288 start_codon:yes stop_codon:yes gene_type:complete